MADPLATPANVAALWRPLTDDEEIVATATIALASALLRHHLPNLDARITAGTLDPVLVAGIVASVVKRTMQANPEGLRSLTVTRGPFTEARTYQDAAEHGLAFTGAELAVLRGGRAAGTRVGTIQVRSRWLDDIGNGVPPAWWQTWTS